MQTLCEMYFMLLLFILCNTGRQLEEDWGERVEMCFIKRKRTNAMDGVEYEKTLA